MTGGIGGMGSRLRGNNGRRAARSLEGLGMTWGGALGMTCGGRKEGMGSRPRLHGDRLYAGKTVGIGGMGSRPRLHRGQALRGKHGRRCAANDVLEGLGMTGGAALRMTWGGALGMMCGGRKEGMGSRPRLHGGRLCAGKTVGIGGMGSRPRLHRGQALRGNNGRRAARFLEGLGMTGGAALRMTWGGALGMMCGGRKEGMGSRPRLHGGQALCSKNGWAREWWWAGGSRTAPTDCYQPGLERPVVSLFS